ncbi:MAG: thioredoxin [Candidatus Gracilibacteria bacterium]|nr:thioredoxin [Candidatus Gracilibacteria bacterium]MDQ7022597.1 thioredoxin [Candidatus Gracilibacteria bacterium]
MAVIVNDTNFKDEIKEGVVLVDFWAEWCGPCQMMLPILEELSTRMEGKAKICKLNVDEAPTTAGEFRVMSIPTLIVFKDGKPVETLVGVQQADSLESTLNKYL